MLGKLAILCAAAVALPAAEPAHSALNKAALEAYVRHVFVFSAQIQVTVGDAQPSQTLPGFLEVQVTASNGPASQTFPFYVSKDGQKILQGVVYDIARNPFKADLDKLKTEFQPSFGTPGASVVLVEFSDFECSFCKEEAAMLRQNLLSAYPKQVRMYFKDFPLTQLHPWAKAASMAGRCIFQQNPNAFWTYHDWIFEHQAEITDKNLREKVLEWATKVKELDALQVGSCMDGKTTEAEVDRNMAEGRALGINSTPTLFVNGRRLVGKLDWPSLRAIIDFEIEYQKTAKNAGEDCGCEVKLSLPGVTK
jgi:protein-disulfide isomerase